MHNSITKHATDKGVSQPGLGLPHVKKSNSIYFLGEQKITQLFGSTQVGGLSELTYELTHLVVFKKDKSM